MFLKKKSLLNMMSILEHLKSATLKRNVESINHYIGICISTLPYEGRHLEIYKHAEIIKNYQIEEDEFLKDYKIVLSSRTTSLLKETLAEFTTVKSLPM